MNPTAKAGGFRAVFSGESYVEMSRGHFATTRMKHCSARDE